MCSFHHSSQKGQSLAAESDRGDLRGDSRVIEVGLGWSSTAAGVENGAVAISSGSSSLKMEDRYILCLVSVY